MDNTNKLMPIYVTQGMSFARAELWGGTRKISEKSRVGGFLLSIPVYALSKATEFAEIPLKLIEDIAFTMINIVGATFSKGCRKNLKQCSINLLKDLGKTTLLTAVVAGAVFFNYLLILFGVIVGGYLVLDLMIRNLGHENIKNNESKNLSELHKAKAIGIHGHENINKLEKLFPNSTFTPKFYKILQNDVKVEEFKDLYEMLKNKNKKTKKDDDVDVKTSNQWKCPNDLKADKSDHAKKITHILRVSHDLNPSTMTKPQLQSYVCKLLDISDDADKNAIKIAKRMLMLTVHPDKVQEPIKEYATEAMQVFNDAWKLYQAE